MSASSKVGAFLRWVLTWPIIVVLALNIETWADGQGYSTWVRDSWKDTLPVLKWLYDTATWPVVFYPTLIATGAIVYEWVAHAMRRAEIPGSKFQRWLLTNAASPVAHAFLHDGLFRKWTRAEEMEKLNLRLPAFGLPPIPENFEQPEEANKIYGGYLSLLAADQLDFAREFHEQKSTRLQQIADAHRSLEGTEEGTQQ